MTIARLKIFFLGMIFGMLVLILSVWNFRDNIINKLQTISFMGSSLKNQVVVIQKDAKLYQGNSEIGFLKKGTVLEYTQHVDKIDHYNLSIIFEASAHEEPLNIFKHATKDYSITTDLIPK
ncbi:hypothetical protein [Sulfurovum sp. TSL1]|uniref:hypothetical protein n=1 Tax=Sulfurovum sp. TSL1 TaxID=2826994 RepID=UPI001CC7A9B2|nr:hypothetical protein [Sulfurovum sp. TSL1]GIT99241.1 hypothetical protein TSL1_20620 [Sulfurovum sp. TSL1]